MFWDNNEHLSTLYTQYKSPAGCSGLQAALFSVELVLMFETFSILNLPKLENNTTHEGTFIVILLKN